MSSSSFYNRLIESVFVEEAALSFPVVDRITRALPDRPVVTVKGPEGIPEDRLNGKTIFVSAPKGKSLSRCPGSRGHLCCNYLTLDLYLGCSLGCSYCIMKSYLNFSPLTVIADPNPGIDAVRKAASQQPESVLRVGTGEVGDSLLLDPLCDLSREYVDGFSDLPNVHFEMKTKTDFVDHLLDVPAKGNAVIGFSVNPPEVIDAEEGTANTLAERIAAAERAVAGGYRVAFHFDPIFKGEGWESRYLSVAESLRPLSGHIAWVSLGTFRYPPSLGDLTEDRPYRSEEFVPSRDGKYRYLQRNRVRMYRRLLEALRSSVEAPVYLCMESDAVWERVFGALPNRIPELRFLWDRPRLPY